MQSLHYNSGSIKLKRERATMVSLWDASEVARWIEGLAGIQSNTRDIFLKHNIDGTALTLLLREDLIRMGITKIDQQLILMQSIDLLLTLVSRLTSETLALLFMHIHCAATTCYNILKRHDLKESTNNNNNNNNSTIMNSPEFYSSISNLSDVIVITCHWLGRLPFIENKQYIGFRGKIIKILVQIRELLRNLRLADQINMPKTKLIVEIEKLRTTAITSVRQNKDSLFSSDCYLTRVHLQRPLKDDVNIEYTTMSDFTHVISSIETEAMRYMGSGYSAINIGDEIIEINNQVVIGWDPDHFNELLRSSSQNNEICLLVKKMPRHNDDEVYTKRFVDGPSNPRRSRARHALEQKQQQTQEYRTILLEQEGEIVIESDDETLYQSKRTSQKKRDQHLSLPDLTENIPNSDNAYNNSEHSNDIEPSSSTSSVSTNPLMSPSSPTQLDIQTKSIERPQSAGSNQSTPKSQRKAGFESYISTLFRPRHDSKSVIADMNDHTNNKDHPQLVNIKRIQSTYQTNSPSNSTISSHDEQMSSSPPATTGRPINKSASQTSLQTTASALSSLTNIFKLSESPDKNRTKRPSGDVSKVATFRNELKMEINSIFGISNNNNNNNNNNNSNVVTNKPPLNHRDSRKSSCSMERRRPKRTPSYKNISCKDLGKGDCEGFLYRYLSKGTLSFVQWRLYWCVLKGGTLYVFKSKDDKNQEVEIKLEGKNVSPAPERKKFGFRITDENSKDREYFACATRDEMAKWMNKMGLAAINFNIDDSKIAGFNKGFIDSRECSPVATPIIGSNKLSSSKNKRIQKISSAGDSENDSDKESIVSWQKSISHNSSISDLDSVKDKSFLDSNKQVNLSSAPHHARSSSSVSLFSLPETNSSPLKSPSNRLLGTFNRMPSSKGHHRTCSSPIKFSPTYEKPHQENSYVNAAPRLSDSDSPNEQFYQRTFVNSKIFNENQTQQLRPTANNYTPLALNSSGGFSTPTTTLSSISSDKTPPISSRPVISLFQPPSENSVFLGDEDLSLPSSRSTSFSFERPNSLSEDAFSSIYQSEIFSPSINTSQRPPLNSSSSSSSAISAQQYSPAIVLTAPVYISVYSTTPPMPIVKSTVSSSASPTNNPESLFSRRSPSPRTSGPLAKATKLGSSPSNVNIPQQSSSPSTHKYHRYLATPSEEQEIQ
ncbi:unnamed protein product [Rotaria socialis]|uniref:Uncharacterized protein n=2 Tax=Rotaria socialis TaxID=392032 RepID=A0A818Z0V5_9BILA|nr:unnamed protein product [Rotaria socialis]CAF4489676.1 unnamed protein product [Rotaria socialis]CAF4516838.1 unnamed protein product [Rotaria socialis]